MATPGSVRASKEPLVRCPWPGNDPLYIRYHDEEWGVPEWDDRALFEKLLLDGFQAGLSWITILRKRESFRSAFAQFDPEKIACFGEADVARLMADAGIIRNQAKVRGSISSAKAYLELAGDGKANKGTRARVKRTASLGPFAALLWSFVGGKPVVHRFTSTSQIPAESPESQAMSKALRKLGFAFVGPTICYAFMQAVGMVNDHLVTCPRHRAVCKV